MSRHVRVTVEGVTTQSDGVLRIRVGAGGPSPAFPLLLIDSGWPGVTVEDVTPGRVWTDGDVIDHNGEVWVRVGGAWRSTLANSRRLEDDRAEATLSLYPRTTTLVRYQHGEQ